MPEDDKQIWVALELRRGHETPSFHGTMAETDFDSILSGACTQPFVTLKNVHWFDPIHSAEQPANLTVYGRGE